MVDESTNTITLQDDLILGTIMDVRKQTISKMQNKSDVIFDFAKVKNFDTSALSLMLVLVREAHHLKLNSIGFSGVHTDMQKMFKLYGVADCFKQYIIS